MTAPEPDPRSAGFTWPDYRPARPRRFSDDEIKAFNRDGFTVLRRAVAAPDLAGITAEVDRFEAMTGPSHLTMEGHRDYTYAADDISFTRNLVARSDLLRRFYLGPLFQDIAHDLLGPDVQLYWDQAVYKKPEKGRNFPWHQDNGYTFTDPLAYLTCWLALADAPEAMGCPWVVPGLHRAGVLKHGDGADGVEILGLPREAGAPVPARAGDMIVFSSLTPHRTGPNRSDRVRKALIVQYAPLGVALIHGDGSREAQDDPVRHPVLLRAGKPPV